MSLYEFAGPDHRDIAHNAAVLCTALLTRGFPLMHWFPAAGLLAPDGDPDDLMIFVVKRPWAEGPELGSRHLLREVDEESLYVLSNAIGEFPDWLGEVLAWTLPAPDPQVAMGGDILHGVMRGTRGFDVSWNGGAGFLTAGHVAPASKGKVFDARFSFVGEVQAFSDPRGSGNAPAADAAVIEWHSTYTNRPQAAQLNAVPARGGDPLSLQLRTGPQPSAVNAFAPYWLSSTIAGTYGDVYATTQCVSAPGDSGAAVINANGDAVGTVVAGAPPFTTLVQDVSYQLSGIRTYLPNLRL
jgi:hypothetical protein